MEGRKAEPSPPSIAQGKAIDSERHSIGVGIAQPWPGASQSGQGLTPGSPGGNGDLGLQVHGVNKAIVPKSPVGQKKLTQIIIEPAGGQPGALISPKNTTILGQGSAFNTTRRGTLAEKGSGQSMIDSAAQA